MPEVESDVASVEFNKFNGDLKINALSIDQRSNSSQFNANFLKTPNFTIRNQLQLNVQDVTSEVSDYGDAEDFSKLNPSQSVIL